MKQVLFMLVMLSLVGTANAQNSKFQALFMYNIVQRIEWPNLVGEFVIGVIGSKDMYNELDLIAQKKKLYGNSIKVVQIGADDLNSTHCHAVYISRSSSSKIDEVNTQVKNKPILVFTDKEGLRGAGINFVDNSQKIEFEIYPSIIKSNQLKIASSLFNLGTVMEN